MGSASIAIVGSGVAAQCCARLLDRAGFHVHRRDSQRPALPAILINATTQGLFEDVFEKPGLLEGLHPIRQRVVAWGGAAPSKLPHSAVVAPEADLLARLHVGERSEGLSDAAWTIMASRPERESISIHGFGDRIAFAVAARLHANSDPFTCWMESTANGWLFLVTSDPREGWLLGVGDTPEALLAESRLVSEQIESLNSEARHFPAHPRIASPLCGPKWLACGSGAMAVDPLCGDGSGYAIREAILAAAVIKAVENGADPKTLEAHYSARLLAGFQKHLQVVESFYQSGGTTAWWTTQAQAARSGIEWCQSELDGLPPFQYRLQGFDLEPHRHSDRE
jgi:2-polyprenyl-6-methoxyphenol hydroxylase-like FAD-dependent oxidoreductase